MSVRSCAIRLAEAIGTILVFPLVIAWRAQLVSFHAVGQGLSVIPGAAGIFVRRGWYESTLARCGARLTVQFGSVLHKPGARIGDDCYIGEHNNIGLVDIGDDFMSASHVVIVSGRHTHEFGRRDVPVRLQPSHFERIAVGADVWVGAAVVISADVADHTVIAAGAVVTKAFDEWQVLGGVPAAPIGVRP